MNKALMKSVIVRNDDTQTSLAAALGLPASSLNNRLNGKVDFRVSEITLIRKRYNLTAEEVTDIFFDDSVSKTDTEGS